jgi:3-phenylpropionate/trans-cinnamate dioxygenase ferredoxin reductase subunit
MTQTIVIVGAGHAAVAAIDHLRRGGFDGRLVLVGDEPYLPYQRPPLSKKFLLGEVTLDRIGIRPEAFYAQHRIETRLHTRVLAVDRAQQVLQLSGDEAVSTVTYDRLILCTGSRVRKLACPGRELAGVHYVRTVDDVKHLQPALSVGKHLVVIGAGYIGLEVAATARKLGVEVTLIELTERCLNRVTAPVVSDFYARRHAEAGVRLLVNTQVAALFGDTHVRGIRCDNGDEISADAVIVGIGVLPNIELAAAAGLDCDNGIVVDAHCRTSDSHIYAAGDCTSHPSARYGGRIRLESVDNAVEQARVAAETLCGKQAEHTHVPWFWSEQYDVRLQTAGLLRDHDTHIVRGDALAQTTGAQFSVWYLKEKELLAVDAINRPGDFMLAKRWIGERKQLDTEQLAHIVDLKTL